MRTATAISSRGTANPQAGQSTFHGRSLGRVNDSPTELEIHSSADRLPGLILCRSGTEAIQEPVASSFRPDDQQAEVTRFLHAGARRVDIGQGSSRAYLSAARRGALPMGGACDYAELGLERMVAERPLPPVHQHRPGYPRRRGRIRH